MAAAPSEIKECKSDGVDKELTFYEGLSKMKPQLKLTQLTHDNKILQELQTKGLILDATRYTADKSVLFSSTSSNIIYKDNIPGFSNLIIIVSLINNDKECRINSTRGILTDAEIAEWKSHTDNRYINITKLELNKKVFKKNMGEARFSDCCKCRTYYSCEHNDKPNQICNACKNYKESTGELIQFFKNEINFNDFSESEIIDVLHEFIPLSDEQKMTQFINIIDSQSNTIDSNQKLIKDAEEQINKLKLEIAKKQEQIDLILKPLGNSQDNFNKCRQEVAAKLVDLKLSKLVPVSNFNKSDLQKMIMNGKLREATSCLNKYDDFVREQNKIIKTIQT